MQRMLMLGTGSGFIHECYETCFLLQNDDKYFMVDTGGSADIDEYTNIVVLNDGDKVNIANRDYTFFDVKASKNKLFGFETILDNNKRLIFLGDETLNTELYKKIENADYVMHEAFCLDAEQDIFKPYEKNTQL